MGMLTTICSLSYCSSKRRKLRRSLCVIVGNIQLHRQKALGRYLEAKVRNFVIYMEFNGTKLTWRVECRKEIDKECNKGDTRADVCWHKKATSSND